MTTITTTAELTANSELVFNKPSILMRLAGWMLGRRGSEFDDPVALHEEVPNRAPPKDAPMPAKFAARFQIEHTELEGQQVVTVHPKSGKGKWHIAYFHGGGFFLPMFKEHWPLIGAMVEETEASISVPLYNVVPEHSHESPTALADALYEHIAKDWDHSNIALAGDSAGGHYALTLALRRRDAGLPNAGKLILFAPWLDLTLADPATRAIEEHDVMLKVDSLRVMGEWFVGGREPKDPQCSPLFCDPAGLPPMEIYQGRYDIFIVDSRSFAAKVAAACVPVRLYEYEGAPHVFMAITASKEAKNVFKNVAAFLG